MLTGNQSQDILMNCGVFTFRSQAGHKMLDWRWRHCDPL